MTDKQRINVNDQLDPSDIERVNSWRRFYLERLSDLLHSLLQQARRHRDTGHPTFFCWDWDMIRSYMGRDEPRNIYAGALVAMAEISAKGGPYIVILDGTRQEVRRYVTHKASRYREYRISRSQRSSSERTAAEAKGVLSDDDWGVIQKHINATLDLKSIRRLHYLLTECAVSQNYFDAEFARLPFRRLKHLHLYADIYQSFKDRHGEFRNEADARNLTRLELAQDEGYEGKLVTGTGLILEDFPELSVSPLNALVSHCLSLEISDPEKQVRSLTRWSRTLYELLEETDDLEEGVRATKKPSNDQLQELLNTLRLYKSDSHLTPLLDLLYQAHAMARDRAERLVAERQQSSQLYHDVPDSRLRRVEFLVEEVLTRSLPDIESLGDMGFTWNADSISDEGPRKFVLRKEKNDQEALTIDVASSYYSVYWPVGLTLEDFLEITLDLHNNKWVPRSEYLWVEILQEGPLLVQKDAVHQGKTWSLPRIIGVKKSKKVIRARIVTDRTLFYYEPPSTNLQHPARFAVVDTDDKFKAVLAAFRESSATFVPASLLQSELGDVYESVA